MTNSLPQLFPLFHRFLHSRNLLSLKNKFVYNLKITSFKTHVIYTKKFLSLFKVFFSILGPNFSMNDLKYKKADSKLVGKYLPVPN